MHRPGLHAAAQHTAARHAQRRMQRTGVLCVQLSLATRAAMEQMASQADAARACIHARGGACIDVLGAFGMHRAS